MSALLQRPGQWRERIRVYGFNRTAATIKKGEVAQMDFARTGGATSTYTAVTFSASENGEGSVNDPSYNFVTPATAGLQSFPMAVAEADIASGDKGWFVISGRCEVAVVDDDVGSGDVNAGDSLTILNGVKYVQIQSSGTRNLGVALEDGAADSTVTARTNDTSSHLRWCEFEGRGLGMGAST